MDESWTTFDEYDERDAFDKLQVLSRSRYLDYVTASHGWYADTVGPAAHYRVWTENEVIDAIAFDPPTLSIVAADSASSTTFRGFGGCPVTPVSYTDDM